VWLKGFCGIAFACTGRVAEIEFRRNFYLQLCGCLRGSCGPRVGYTARRVAEKQLLNDSWMYISSG